MASLIQWTCVWASSKSWWWTGYPGVLQSMGSQRVGHNWATELTEHESATGIHMSPTYRNPIPPPFPLYLSELSQSTSFGCPVTCIELLLFICFMYGNIHVSVLFSQIIPCLPSPTESKKSVLYISVSFADLHVGSSVSSFYISYICINVQYLYINVYITLSDLAHSIQ